MPGRLTPIVSNQIYHIYNRGIDRRPTFTDKREYERALETIRYYRFKDLPLRLSKFITLDDKRKAEILQIINESKQLIKIISFNLMPNHFHFLLRQEEEKGISTFLSNFQNSYTRYFNTKHNRDGSLFLDQFKAVLVETDEQLIHLSRYIHLNPYTSFVIKKIEDLRIYPYSSFPMYLTKSPDFVDKDLILKNFRNISEYGKFVFDQGDYQRRLEENKHLSFD